MRNRTGVSAAGVRVTLRTSDSCSFACFLLLRLYLSALVPAQNAVYLVRSLSPSVPICVSLSLFCPPALRSCLMTYMFFSAVRLATVSRSTEPLASAWQPRWPVTHTVPLVLYWPISLGVQGNHCSWHLSLKPTSCCLRLHLCIHLSVRNIKSCDRAMSSIASQLSIILFLLLLLSLLL